jgi:hypothetical protein
MSCNGWASTAQCSLTCLTTHACCMLSVNSKVSGLHAQRRCLLQQQAVSAETTCCMAVGVVPATLSSAGVRCHRFTASHHTAPHYARLTGDSSVMPQICRTSIPSLRTATNSTAAPYTHHSLELRRMAATASNCCVRRAIKQRPQTADKASQSAPRCNVLRSISERGPLCLAMITNAWCALPLQAVTAGRSPL